MLNTFDARLEKNVSDHFDLMKSTNDAEFNRFVPKKPIDIDSIYLGCGCLRFVVFLCENRTNLEVRGPSGQLRLVHPVTMLLSLPNSATTWIMTVPRSDGEPVGPALGIPVGVEVLGWV